MPFNDSSYEQTRIVRDAVEIVIRLTGTGDTRRSEIAEIIFRIADHDSYDASALTNLALAEMAESWRKSA